MDNFMEYNLSSEANISRFENLHCGGLLKAQGAGNNGRIPPFDGNVYIEDVQDETEFAISVLLTHSYNE